MELMLWPHFFGAARNSFRSPLPFYKVFSVAYEVAKSLK